MADKSILCKECDRPAANSANVLARHLRSVHGMEWADYVVKHEHGGTWPTCACGCGERLTWRKGGFGKYVRGHDGPRPIPTVTIQPQAGWTLNPFTGREERLSDDEAALLGHCVLANDPITHDHGIRIAWKDSAAAIKFITPAFKHLMKRLVMLIDEPGDPEYGRRMVGVRDWCNEHKHIALVLCRRGAVFDVVGGYRPEGVEG